MEGIKGNLKQIQKRIEKVEKLVSPNEQELPRFKCDICKDEGYIRSMNGIYEEFRPCKCRLLLEVQSRMDNSGMAGLLKTNTFDNYKTDKKFQKVAKDLALEYVEEYKKSNKYSFAMLGQSGIGKTHLTVAISKELLEHGVNVKYYIADEIIQTLQACKYDEQNYHLEFAKIVNCRLLVIDDLFKTSITNYYNKESIKSEDLREIFKIINYRYNQGLPVLVSSEVNFERLAKLDQALAGRINQMCNYKYLISVGDDASKNYRINQ